MTEKEMREACLKASKAIIDIGYAYGMTDTDFELYYHMVAGSLVTSTVSWAKERWLEAKGE